MLREILKKLIRKEDLNPEEARLVMSEVMTGQAGDIRTAGILVALSCKGETAGEIEAFARVMRQAAVSWPGLPEAEDHILCDTCGTGGDASNTLNISTLSAILLAAMGIRVAKHGNRAVSSKFGSADLLEAMDIQLNLDHKQTPTCLDRIGICFLFAQSWHPAMKFAAPVRKGLGVRTVFNLLGPLTNPAPITHQAVGLFDEKFMEPVGQALAGLGRTGAYVVHSEDGLDEVSISAPTRFVQVEDGAVKRKGVLTMEDFGMNIYPLSELQVQGRDEALERAQAVLSGKGKDSENTAICVNAALLYSLVKKVPLPKAAAQCMDMVKSGEGEKLIQRWQQFYHDDGSTVLSLGHLRNGKSSQT